MKEKFFAMSIKEKIQFVCVFLPVLCTVAWVIYSIAGNEIHPIVEGVTDVLLIIGLIAALIFIVLTDAISFLKFVLSFIGKGWVIGMGIFPIFPFCFFTAVCGLGIAFVAIFALCTMLPVAITVYYYFFRK